MEETLLLCLKDFPKQTVTLFTVWLLFEINML